MNFKPEIRSSKSEIRKKSEARNPNPRVWAGFRAHLRHSDFGFGLKLRPRKSFLLCFAAIFLLAGCAGYHLGPANEQVAGAKTVEVQPFNNLTLQPRLGDAVTQSLRERLQTEGTYRLVSRGGTGDVVVTGVIRQYTRQGLGFLNTDVVTPENYRVDLVVHVIARDRLSGKTILDKDVRGHTFVHIGDDLASAEREALPLLAEDLAQNISELLTEGAW